MPRLTDPANETCAPRAIRLWGIRAWAARTILDPIVALLRVGATPEKLAWSLAVGIACGINPLLGSTTIVCLLVAAITRLNLVASQIANHLCYPLEVALFFVFIRIGDRLFHTGQLPLSRQALFHGLREHPIATTRELWSWEWHALIVWFLFALILTPVLATAFTPVLRRLARQQA